MDSVKTKAPDKQEALSLYRGTIFECFATAADRAAALGISETAIRKWDSGDLHFVKRASAARVLVVARTCDRLGSFFGRRRDIGDYLLHEVFEANRRIRPLDLVVRTCDPEAAVELFEATRSATAEVVTKRLPAHAFVEGAWAHVLEALSADERQLEEELHERDAKYSIPSAL